MTTQAPTAPAPRFTCEYDPDTRDWLILEHGKPLAIAFNESVARAIVTGLTLVYCVAVFRVPVIRLTSRLN